MNETATYADVFNRAFAHEPEFLAFLDSMQARSHWDRQPTRELEVIALDEHDPLTRTLRRQYAHQGLEGVLDDTMEHTRLLLKAQDELTPVRSCAIKTILDRARISGSALSQLSKPHLAEILNRCLNIARGDALLWYSDGKVSAVHGGDASDYAVLEIPELFEHTVCYLNRHYPGYTFAGGSFDHAMVTAVWELTGQDSLTETYRNALARHDLLDETTRIRPAVRLSTSNTGISGANLYPMLLEGDDARIIPLGCPIRENHKGGADLDRFDANLEKLFAQYDASLSALTALLDVELAYPVNAMQAVLKELGVCRDDAGPSQGRRHRLRLLPGPDPGAAGADQARQPALVCGQLQGFQQPAARCRQISAGSDCRLTPAEGALIWARAISLTRCRMWRRCCRCASGAGERSPLTQTARSAGISKAS